MCTYPEAWNHHPLSTEDSRTPLQLYTAYSVGSDVFADEDLPVSLEEYGFDPDDPTVDEVQDE